MSQEDENFPRNPFGIFLNDFRSVLKLDELGLEISRIALPAVLALSADPIASIIDTAFIGQIGPVELAAVGVSIALFNQVLRIAILPLLNITTSFVAEEDACSSQQNTLQDHEECVENVIKEKRNIPSASSALLIGGVLGLIQAVFLIYAAKYLLSFMGVKEDSPMMRPAQRYLRVRSLGTPAILLSVATQGVFRGLKDTKTLLYATLIGSVTNIILDPIFIFGFNLGVAGAAIAHVISQYLMCAILLWKLMEQVDIFTNMSTKYHNFLKFMKNGSIVLTRVIVITFCLTLAASLAAREGHVTMAAFQVCFQVWFGTSFVADGFGIAGQALIASAFATKDYKKAIATASRIVQMGLVLGIPLAFILGAGLHFGARLFTKDHQVLYLISIALPFVAGTQPINSLAFVIDGVNFGASDFAYASGSLVMVALVCILCLLFLSKTFGFIGLWLSLSIYMSLRVAVGFGRIGTGSGPWSFLRSYTRNFGEDGIVLTPLSNEI